MLAPVPGSSGAAGNSQRDSFEKWITKRAKEIKEARLEVAREEMKTIVQDLVDNGPVWTGASAGVTDSRVVMKPMPKWHPAFGMRIGNVLNGGESGWQIYESARRSGQRVTLSIVNPMWNFYLKFVEKGVAPFQKHPGHFVRDAWMRHKSRRQ